MKINEISVNFGRTVATQVKFEFLRIDVSMKASIDPDLEDKQKSIKLLKAECKAACEGMIYKELEAMHGGR